MNETPTLPHRQRPTVCPDEVFEAKSNSQGKSLRGPPGLRHSKQGLSKGSAALSDRAGPRRKKAELEAEGSTQ